MKRPFILAIGLIAACAVQARDLVIENPTIRLDCTRPSSCAVTDRQTGQTIELDVDSFQVVMGDGRRLSVPSLVEVSVPTLERMAGLPAAVRISEREPGELVERRFRSADGKIAVRWTAWLRLKSRYARFSTEVTNTAGAPLSVSEVQLIAAALPGARMEGSVMGSPVVAGSAFLGVEHPLAANRVSAGRVRCGMPRLNPLPPGATLEVSAVVGFADAGQLRRQFGDYVERERARPFQPLLHENTWWDIACFSTFTEGALMAEISGVGRELVTKRGVKLDLFEVDDGWDDPHSLWEFNRDFPHGLTGIRGAARAVGAGIGLWLSPWGGYGPPKQERLRYGMAEGFEVRDGSFALAGPKYHARFRDRCLEAIRSGVEYFKIDGIGMSDHSGRVDPPAEGDFDSMLRLIRELRELRPSLYVNLTTGTWPSPFWLRDVDSTWRGGKDYSFAGPGTQVQRWMTYRDSQTYANVVRRAPLYPLNSLMLHGIIYSRMAGALAADPGADFAAEVRAYFGAGTQLQELYLSPDLLSAGDWDNLAAAARWARANADVLRDVHWIGGDPGKLEPYGWAAWTPAKGILTLRNPGGRRAAISIDPAESFELPSGSSRTFSLSLPLQHGTAPLPTLRCGVRTPLQLEAFQVVVLEAR